jgi:hypothetical protein
MPDSTISNIPDQQISDPNLVSQSTAQQFQQAASQATPAVQGSAPQAQGTPQAGATQAPQGQPQPQPNQAQPGQGQANQPNQPNQQGQPPQKQSAFNKVLEMATGGPIKFQRRDKDENGNYTGGTTNVVQHQSSKVLAATILAHAVQGFLAGTGAQNYQEAAQAGAKVGQQQAQQQAQRGPQAQQRDDQALANQINITDHNLKTHALMLDLAKQQSSQMQSTVDDASPILNSLELAQKDSKDPLILKAGLSEADLEKLLSDGTAHVTRQNAIPDGVTDVYDASGKQVMNPDGTPKKTYTFTVYNPSAMVTLTDELRKTNPELATAAPGQAMPVKVLAGLWLKRGQNAAAQGYVDDFQKRMDALTGKTSTPVDFNAGVKANPVLAGVKPILGRYAGMDPDQALDQMRKDKVDPNIVGAFQKFMNISDTDLSNAREASKKKADIANDPDKQPAPLAQVASFPADVQKNYPGLTPGQVDSLQKQLGPAPTQADYQKALDRAEKYDAANTARNLAREKQDQKESGATDDVLTTPDALGFAPNVPGGLKEYNSRQKTFKKNADDLQKTEGTYQQFNSILDDVKAGKDLTGAQSVVALFNAIGISATPLAGKGFRINNNTIQEHAEARGLGQSLYQKLLGLKDGDVITPQQIKDYANIATQARQDQYINLVNQVHNQGLNANFVLPTGNGQKIDPSTAKIFLQLTGGNMEKARKAAQAKGWGL